MNRRTPAIIYVFTYIFAISLAILVLIFFEGLITLGVAFKFETYTVVTWIAQICAFLFVISVAVMVTYNELKSRH